MHHSFGLKVLAYQIFMCICTTVKVPTMSINHVSLYNQQRIFVTEKLLIRTALQRSKPIKKSTYVMHVEFKTRCLCLRVSLFSFLAKRQHCDRYPQREATHKNTTNPFGQNGWSVCVCESARSMCMCTVTWVEWETNREKKQWKNHWFNPLITISTKRWHDMAFLCGCLLLLLNFAIPFCKLWLFCILFPISKSDKPWESEICNEN